MFYRSALLYSSVEISERPTCALLCTTVSLMHLPVLISAFTSVMPRTDDPPTPESGAVGGDFILELDCVPYR